MNTLNTILKYLIATVLFVGFTNSGVFAEVSLNIAANTTLAVDGSINISLSGNWKNLGTFNAGTGEVIFNGTTNQTITNASGETFFDVTINKASGDLQLVNNATVNGIIALLNGDVDLNSQTITLGTTASLSESAGNTVKGAGEITTTRNLNAPTSDNVGGMGFEITTAVNLGSTVLSRKHDVQTISGDPSILRYFDITPTTNSGLSASLVYHYDDSELNGRTEANLLLFRSIDSGLSWTNEGGTVNTGSNTIALGSIDAFSRWGVTSPDIDPIIFRVERTSGNVYADGAFTGGGADLAERINVSEMVEPGDVIELDPGNPGFYRKSRGHSKLIAGVVTTAPGFTLGNNAADIVSNELMVSAGDLTLQTAKPMLALVGRVPVKATTENGVIRPGDLITVSQKAGYATRCIEGTSCNGIILGKALGYLSEGEGMVLVLVTAH